MTSFDQKEFNLFIIDNNVIGFFDEPVKLKSGRVSNWYVNWRTLCGDVYLVDRLTDYIISFINDKKIDFDIVYGVPEGATKLGLMCQYKYSKFKDNYSAGAYGFLMGRGSPKEHGAPKDKFFLGDPKGRIIVLEDVTTTGGSLISAIENLRSAGADVVAAIGLTNRMQKRDDGKGVEEFLAEMNVAYFAMSEATDLLPLAMEIIKPKTQIIDGIRKEFEEFGIKLLKID